MGRFRSKPRLVELVLVVDLVLDKGDMKYLFVLVFGWFCLKGQGQGIDVQKYRYELELRDGSDAITGNALVTVKFLAPVAQFRLDLGSFDNEKGIQAFSVKEGEKMLRYTHAN